ncbi:MAG: hypothetical protein ABR591_12170 [Candidatus Velthaea sp.]
MTAVLRTRAHWIPPWALGGALAAQLAAWLLVAVAGAVGMSGALALAWVHVVALGWLTVTAFAVLLHVIPAFTDRTWRMERLARASLALLIGGAGVLAAGFAAASTTAVTIGAAASVLAIAAYACAALATLVPRVPGDAEAAIARALAATITALACAALFGAVLAFAYVTGRPAILRSAPSHAALGIVAWLAVLVTGVSTRTLRPMLGTRSRHAAAHMATGFALFLGAFVLAARFDRIGAAVITLGVVIYIADAGGRLIRATVRHRPPQAFVGASLAWLAAAAACLLAAAFGAPAAARFAVFFALAGFVGQMVNAHFHHLGVRVLTTLIRGDDDETPPAALLDRRLSWTAFATAQTAVAATAAGLAADPRWCTAGAAAGIAATAATAANARRVLRRARGGLAGD